MLEVYSFLHTKRKHIDHTQNIPASYKPRPPPKKTKTKEKLRITYPATKYRVQTAPKTPPKRQTPQAVPSSSFNPITQFLLIRQVDETCMADYARTQICKTRLVDAVRSREGKKTHIRKKGSKKTKQNKTASAIIQPPQQSRLAILTEM